MLNCLTFRYVETTKFAWFVNLLMSRSEEITILFFLFAREKQLHVTVTLRSKNDKFEFV